MTDTPQQPLRATHAVVGDLDVVTDEALTTTLPEGLYFVADERGKPLQRIGGERLLARVRRDWGRTPGRIHHVFMRKDGLQVLWQWEHQLGTWPEDERR